jgi:FeS assembly protein IscX
MPSTFGWDNLEDIAIGLADKFPDTDPLTVRFTDMHKWITELPGFSGDSAASNESKLEAIQMAWNEEFQDRKS